MSKFTRKEMITDLESEGIVRDEAIKFGRVIRVGDPPLVSLANKLEQLGVESLGQLSDEQLVALHFEWIRGQQIPD